MSNLAGLEVSAPSNLLLFGEYAVTIPGGLGIACGIEPRVSARLEEAASFAIHGTTGRESFEWKPDGAADLLSACVQEAATAAGYAPVGHRPAALEALEYRVTIDSSALYRTDGGKRGLGSSATVSVTVCALLLYLFLRRFPTAEEVLDVALKAHRASQGGRGSGYDVAASTYGGLGLFEGGRKPGWRPLDDAWLPPLSLREGPKPVSTGPAIRYFEAWRLSSPEAFAAFFEASNAAVLRLGEAGSWTEAAGSAQDLARIARDLGHAIGVSAEVPPAIQTCREIENHSSLQARPTMVKAVGAGGELFVSFGCDEAPLRLSEGLRWHT